MERADELKTCPVSPTSPLTGIQDPGTNETSEAAAEQVKTKAQLWIRKLKPTSFGGSVAEKTKADRRVATQVTRLSIASALPMNATVPRDGPCTFYPTSRPFLNHFQRYHHCHPPSISTPSPSVAGPTPSFSTDKSPLRPPPPSRSQLIVLAIWYAPFLSFTSSVPHSALRRSNTPGTSRPRRCTSVTLS